MSPAPGGTGDLVLSLVRERIKDLFENLPLAMAGREEPVHQIRVAARRIRVILPLSAVKPGGRRVRRALGALKTLTRTAGASRDLDVMVGLLPKTVSLGPAGKSGRSRSSAPFAQGTFWPFRSEGSYAPDDTQVRSLLARRLRDARARARRRMTEGLLDFDIAGLRKDLRRIAANGVEDRFMAIMRVRLVRETEGTALLAEMGSVSERFDPEALHAVRTRVRRLRYAAEFGAALAGAPPEAAKRFREIQELLGELHDAWVLAQWLGRQRALALERGRVAEAEEAARLEAASEDLSRALHGKYLESAPAEKARRALSLVGRRLSVA